MTKIKDDFESIHPGLLDVALIDAAACASAGGMGVSWWHARVAAGEAPKPAIQQARMTRWRLSEVRAFWSEYPDRLRSKDTDDALA
jgi:predicted DNA-binding transcriptional regulator AlpA